MASEAPLVRASLGRMTAGVLARSVVSFVEDRGSQLAAAISFFALFSLFPLALFSAAVFGIVLRNEELQSRTLEAIVDALPVQTPSVEQSLRALADLGPTLSVVSLLTALWVSGALATALRSGLDVVFDVERGRPYFRAKLFDYIVVLAAGALFLASTVATTGWRIVEARADARLGLDADDVGFVWDVGALVLPAALTFATFVLLYRALPHRATQLAHVWPGALLAAVLFELAKVGFAIYLANAARYQVVYGSLGGVIALLLWVYVSANILLFGAEVAAEFGHLRRGEPRHGHAFADDGDWRASLVAMVRGLMFAPSDDAPAKEPGR
jgi:membrane protein